MIRSSTPISSIVSDVLLGPLRVLPGRLSVKIRKVSRTFGDPEAKLEHFGGKKNIVIANPDIINFKINNDHDFIVMACILKR